MMQKKTGYLLITVTVVSILLAAFCLAIALRPEATAESAADTAVPAEAPAAAEEPEKDVQYILYLGTNDGETNEPVCTPEEAMDQVVDILFRHVGGYTIQEAHGGWIDEDGTRFAEYTLVITLSYTDLDTVHALSDDLLAAFRQSSVLIQTNETISEYYYGIRTE